MVQKKVLHITVTYPLHCHKSQGTDKTYFQFHSKQFVKALTSPSCLAHYINTFLISLCKDGGKHLNHA